METTTTEATMKAQPLTSISQDIHTETTRRNHDALLERRREESAQGSLSSAWSFRSLKAVK